MYINVIVHLYVSIQSDNFYCYPETPKTMFRQKKENIYFIAHIVNANTCYK